MRRILFALLLAIVGAISTGSLGSAVPRAHAEATPPSMGIASGSIQVGATGTITGRNFTPNNWAYVFYQRPDRTTNAVFVQTNAAGTFTLNLTFSAAHGTGTEYVAAFDYGTGSWSPFIAIVVTPVTPVTLRQLTLSAATVTVGGTITVTGTTFTPNNWVYVYFQRPNGTVGAFWVQTGATGGFASLLGFNAANGCGNEFILAYDFATQRWSSPATVAVTGCTVTTISPPSNLQVVSVTQQQTLPLNTLVTLRWQDNSTGETGFRIHTTFTRVYSSGDSQTQDVPANTTTAGVSFVAGGINPVKSACFTVTALSGSGESAPSNAVCVSINGG